MSKVLGFTKNGGEDWFLSSKYNTKEIIGIEDPEGGKTENPPTAIPSPFARIDLVRKSFDVIAQSPKLAFFQRGSSIVASREDERNVSRCLDLAEMLFYYDTYRENLQIIEWNKDLEIEKLKTSTNLGHRRLGDVLAMYLRQDAKSFHFDKLSSIYIIKYNYRVIGGTSPLSLFFNVADDISVFNLKSIKGKTFFKDIVPLYERDEEFQRYLYLLFSENAKLKDKMKAFWNYLETSLKNLEFSNPTLFKQINSADSKELNHNYSSLHTEAQGQYVEVFGCELKYLGSNKITTLESDFTIHSTKYSGEKKPLVLQNKFNKPLKYIKGNWISTTVVPYQDTESLLNRTLPGLNIKFPYLTVSDFLEDSIIRLVYPIDEKTYFNGNLKLSDNNNTKSYLLPLKPSFFDYFNAKDLLSDTSSTPNLELREGIAESVTATLRIPIKGGSDFIVFERTYYKDGAPDAKENKGKVEEQQVGVTIFPFIEFPEGVLPHYNVQLIDRNIRGSKFNISYGLKFYDRKNSLLTNEIESKFRTRKVKDNYGKVETLYSKVESRFDYIQVKSGEATGLVIPMFKAVSGTGKSYHFAIDFGTTNSHIEYSVGDEPSRAFDITNEDIQAVSMIANTKHNFSGTAAMDLKVVIDKEFVPASIGEKSESGFPTRTVISNSVVNLPKTGGKTLIDFNIPFMYGREEDRENVHTTNLKWDNRDALSELRTRAFLEQLVLLLRNKVLTNGGDLSLSKIAWTYPTSMPLVKRDRLGNLFKTLLIKYFGQNIDLCGFSESIAPYYYFKSVGKLAGKGYGVSALVDIGGGTSDVTIFNDNTPVLISSYRFAGNALFGDGYNKERNIKSALAQVNKRILDELLAEHSSTMRGLPDNMYSEGSSADYHNFLFSLISTRRGNDSDLFDFNKKLSENEDLKIVFLYFFAAKMYHIAHLLKQKNIGVPENIVFSGNGSKIINIISPNIKRLEVFAEAIFKAVLPDGDKRLKMITEWEFAKQSTAMGAIRLNKDGLDIIDERGLIYTLHFVDTTAADELTYKNFGDNVSRIENDVKVFNAFFVKLLDDTDAVNTFGVNRRSVDIFKATADTYVGNYISLAFDYNKRLDGDDNNLEMELSESPFFYPIVQIIQDLYTNILSDESID